MSGFSGSLTFLFAAKNLVLAGVKSVTLHDEGTVELWDLSSNFIFSEDDVGKNRAVASIQKLQELNNSVVISTITSNLTKEQLSDFQVCNLSTASTFMLDSDSRLYWPLICNVLLLSTCLH